MAWREGDGGRQFRKDSSAAKRPQLNLSALTDQENAPAPHKKLRTRKPFGLKLYWMSMFQGRETFFQVWFGTERARATARKKYEAERQFNLPRYTKIEDVER